MAIKHTKTSGKPAPADTSLVGGPDWDDDHTIDPATITLAQLAADVPAAIGLPWSGTVTTPATLSAAVNNWDPFGGDAAARIILAQTNGVPQDITGMVGGSARKCVAIFNVGTSGNLNFKRDSASSTAGNKFAPPAGAGDFAISPGSGRMLYYDGTAPGYWRPLP